MRHQFIIGSCSVIFNLALVGSLFGQTIGVQRGFEANASYTAATPGLVPFATTPLNVGGFTTAANTIGTAPSAGLYTVAGNLSAVRTAGTTPVDVNVLVNGLAASRFQYNPGAAAFSATPFNTLVSLNAGDVVSVQVAPQTGTSVDVTGFGGFSIGSMSKSLDSTGGVRRGISTNPQYAATSAVGFDTTPLNVGGYTTAANTVAAAPINGLYTVAGNLTGRLLAGTGVAEVQVLVNGTAVSRHQYTLGTTNTAMPFSTLANLTAGQTVSLQITPPATATVEVTGVSDFSHATMNNPSLNAIGVQRGITANQTYSTPSTVAFNTTLLNVGFAAPTGNNIGTAPTTGLYTVAGNLTGRVLVATTSVQLQILVNGVTVPNTPVFQYNIGTTNTTLSFNSLLNLTAGQTVSLQILNGGADVVIFGGNDYSTAWLAPVPEPAHAVLLGGLGLVATRLVRRRRGGNRAEPGATPV